ncbi:T9SS type A sorting domain-containing protein [candidate division KSB1 bacterium]|nr:T9SS type A sorting domain-containing protein [candidate division KSB1 bacterium]
MIKMPVVHRLLGNGCLRIWVILLFMSMTLFIPVSLFAQKDTVYVQDYFQSQKEGTLNSAIETALHAGTLSNTVFMLSPYGLYILNETIATPAGETLEIIAPKPGVTQETAPPMIAWTSSDVPYKRHNFNIAGEVKMKNVWLFYASMDSARQQLSFRVGDSAAVQGGRCEFENVIFDYSATPQTASGAVEIYARRFQGSFKNCYFRNCADDHFRYYGRALSFPFMSQDLHADSVVFENCTFANIGYVYMQEGGEYSDFVKVNHCTFLNVAMFTLQSGWWRTMSVTNSIFVNTYMYGRFLWEGDFSGTITVVPVESFEFAVPFTDQDRRILFANNSYFIEPWLSNWMATSPHAQELISQNRIEDVPVPQPMLNPTTQALFDSVAFPFMNSANLFDSTYPGFINPPTDTTLLKNWLYHKWNDGADAPWAWKPENSFQRLWPLKENLAYTNDTLLTAGMGGFPLGDLYHWFPERYVEWDAQRGNENTRIAHWRDIGYDSIFTAIGEVQIQPTQFGLSQNYPNPFNPTTKIDYSLADKGRVSLKVFDLLGREIITLVEGTRPAGEHTVTFEAGELASGIYIYQLRSGQFVESKKFLIIK